MLQDTVRRTVTIFLTTDWFIVNLVHLRLNVSPNMLLMCRSFRRFDVSEFRKSLESIEWTDVIRETNIDKKLENFNTPIISLSYWHAPMVTSRVPKSNAMWCCPELKCLMSKRGASLRKYKRSKLPENFAVYKRLKNLIVNSVRMEKRRYIGSVASS